MSMEQNKYSILMSVYKNDNPEWFDFSIRSMLKQTLFPDEFVIVEDGPVSDEIEAVVQANCRSYPDLFHIIRLKENLGLGEAMRIGVLECRNEWIARMDSDDYSCPDRIEKELSAAVAHGADIVGTDVAEFTGTPDEAHRKAIRAFPEGHDDLIKFGKRRTPFAHPAVLMKKSKVLSAGNYQTAYLHEDFDLFVRMFRDGCIGYTVKEILVYVRIGEDFYERRGGVSYLKALLKFNWKQLAEGWMGISDFAIRSAGNIAFCLMPNSLRDYLYRRVLRK